MATGGNERPIDLNMLLNNNPLVKETPLGVAVI
jgi:hypothetical protein